MRSRICICQVFAIFAVAFKLCSQDFAITWHTTDGGGGVSTGGVYSVSGTIGQPDACSAMTNGQYSLSGGFWAAPLAVQTAGAPRLNISSVETGFVQISWTPAMGTNWVLQQTTTLLSSQWTNSPSGFTNPIIVPAPFPRLFYRLYRP